MNPDYSVLCPLPDVSIAAVRELLYTEQDGAAIAPEAVLPYLWGRSERFLIRVAFTEGLTLAKLLIVDDDKTTVGLLKTLLELDGFDVQTVGRGADVLSIVSTFQPDVILMDYHLSDIKGIEVLRALRSHDDYATLPVVMASGLDVGSEVLAAGANRFLVKPFEPDELPTIFNDLIAAS